MQQRQDHLPGRAGRQLIPDQGEPGPLAPGWGALNTAPAAAAAGGAGAWVVQQRQQHGRTPGWCSARCCFAVWGSAGVLSCLGGEGGRELQTPKAEVHCISGMLSGSFAGGLVPCVCGECVMCMCWGWSTIQQLCWKQRLYSISLGPGRGWHHHRLSAAAKRQAQASVLL